MTLRRLASTLAWVACLGDSPSPLEAGPGWLEQRWEIDAEYTDARAGDSIFNRAGDVLEVEPRRMLLRGHSDASARLASWLRLKTRVVGQIEGDSHSRADGALRELYAHASLGPAEASVGRKILKWSGGYAFNPAGVLDPARDPADPQDRLGGVRGRDLVQVDIFAGDQTWTVAAASRALLGDADEGDTVVAARYERRIRALQVAALAGWRPEGRDTLAFTMSLGIGKRLAVHGEMAAAQGTDALFPRSILEGGQRTLYAQDFWAPLKAGEDRAVLKGLVGFNYTLPGGVNVIAEYYRNGEGLEGGEWERFFDQATFSRSRAALGSPAAYDGKSLAQVNLLLALSGLGDTRLGRDYLFLRLATPRIAQKMEATLLGITNLRDRSVVAVPEVGWVATKRLFFYVRGSFFWGSSRSEYGNVPLRKSLNVGSRLFF